MSNFNSRTLVMFVRTMAQAMPHGGKKDIAGKLGLTPSGLSKLLSDEERGFDEKTLRAVAWVQTSKASLYPVDQYPIEGSMEIGPLIIETRKGGSEGKFYVWKTASAARSE